MAGLPSDPEMSWRYVGASVIGTSHQAQELPCQDHSLVRVLRDGVLFAVVSDGAGSAKHSDVGSYLLCHTLIKEVAAFLEAGGAVATLSTADVDLWLGEVFATMHRAATSRDCPVRELACTLVAAFLGPDASAYLQVGDGGIVIDRGEGYEPATWPASGEYANTTFFVTDDRALENATILLAQPPVDEIALFTDGLQMLALQFDQRRAHAPFFRPMFGRLRSEPEGESLALNELLGEYLASPTVNARTDDDKSLILATRLAAEAVPAPSQASRPERDDQPQEPASSER
jgi:hypothetical protein